MPPIRRLTVLQDASTADEDRPAWHWAIIGLLFVYSIFAPLALVANWIAQRWFQSRFGDAPAQEIARRMALPASGESAMPWLALGGPPLLTFVFSCWAAGALVGRFGTKAGLREAMIAGVLAALCSWALVLVGSGFWVAAAALVVLLPAGALGSWLGGRFGLRMRKASAMRAPPPPPARNV